MNITENHLCLLIEKLIEKKQTEDILYFINFISTDKYPNLLLRLGDYFNEIDDSERMLYFYDKGLLHETIKDKVLFEISCHYISKDMYKEFHDLAKKYNFDEDMYKKVANKFFLPNVDLKKNQIYSKDKLNFVAEIFSRYNDATSIQIMNHIHRLNRNFGQYIKTHLVLVTKYQDDRSETCLKDLITDVIIELLQERDKKFFGASDKKCYICRKCTYSYITIECNHNICERCSYNRINRDDCLVYCTCGYKSSFLFNLLINHCQKKTDDMH